MHQFRIVTLLLVAVLAGSSQVACAQDHAAALKDYLTDDVVGVVYVDVSKIDVVGVIEWAIQLGIIPSDFRQEAMESGLEIQGRLDELVDFGAPRVYILLRLTELGSRWPAWVVPIAAGGNSDVVKTMLRGQMLGDLESEPIVVPEYFPQFLETVDGVVLGATTAEQMATLKSARPAQPQELTDAWEALGQGAGGLILFGDKDSRRVVRELFPSMPPPFDSIDGNLLADGVKWAGLSVNLPPEPRIEFQLETASGDVAQTFQTAANQLLTIAKMIPIPTDTIDAESRAALVEGLAPQVEGTRLRIAPTDLVQNVERLSKLLTPAVREMRQDAQRMTRMNQFKQITLGILNYEDRSKMFPWGANEWKDDKPLLSWRVLILPYLDQGALYSQFHLDEPWDSEHNKKLIAKMPAIYADPDRALREINEAGRTTYVVPHGPETINPGQETVTFKQITDGLSNTIMVVEVPPDRAEIWTRPSEEEFDMFHPWLMVRRPERNWFTAGSADGAAHIFDEPSVPSDKLRALLTRAGREVIDW